MSDIVIHVEGLGKQYPKGVLPGVTDHFRRNGRHSRFWALREITFAVRRGESLGIIGGNGAGKSTLLRILSRITRPTEGRAVIHGTVAALLDVGTGFHPELTGLENIYLRGALLGLRDRAIDARLADIIEFAGIGDFIHTPFKRYSRGMKARLGFSIAVHLDSDILLLDEVLAVGDVRFRQQGVEKLAELVRTDRTVVFVGHHRSMITSLCDRALWLERGQLKADGKAESIMRRYVVAETTDPRIDGVQLELFE